MDLSIIIPVHNTEKWLPELLESLKKQKTDYKYEIIFVFDSCTDNSKDLVEMSGLADLMYSCEAHSCGIARNKGLEYAKGKYIWFIDSDDYLTEETAIQDVLDFVQGKDIVRIPFESDKFNQSCYAMVWQYCFSRELIGDTRFVDVQPREDNKFMDDIFKKIDCTKIESLIFPVYFYRYLREGSNMFKFLKGEEI